MDDFQALGTVYLDAEDVVAFHADLFKIEEREARRRLRSPEGLASALGRPIHYAHYAGSDLAYQAAVLAHAIAEGQHFTDGNKRTALVAMRVFLVANGYTLSASQEQRAKWILALSGGLAIEDLADQIRQSITPLAPAAIYVQGRKQD